MLIEGVLEGNVVIILLVVVEFVSSYVTTYSIWMSELVCSYIQCILSDDIIVYCVLFHRIWIKVVAQIYHLQQVYIVPMSS